MINEESFADTPLRSIFIPKNVEEIGEASFAQCSSLRIVSFEANRSCHLSLRAEAFRASGIELIDIRFRCNELVIEKSCFHKCDSLGSVQLPVLSVHYFRGSGIFSNSGIKEFRFRDVPREARHLDRQLYPHNIPGSTFRESSLAKIVIPRIIQQVGASCFFGCRSLSEVSFKLPSEVRNFKSRAFAKSGVRKITLPRSLEVIGSRCFCECLSLSIVCFEERSNLLKISQFAFSSSSLTTFCIPGNVFSVCGSSFDTTSSITVETGNQYFAVDSSFLYDSTRRKIIRYFGNDKIVYIANGIEVIG
jgi:hypothetical protein